MSRMYIVQCRTDTSSISVGTSDVLEAARKARELFEEGRSVCVRDELGKRFGLEEIEALALKLSLTA